MYKTNIGKKYRKHSKQRGIIIALAVVIFLCYFCFSFAETIVPAGKNKIVVGYPLLKSVHEVDSNGNYSGYNYEYLQDIAKYTGWEYEFVIDSWDNCIKGLESGTIDMMGYVSKTEERQEFLEFTKIYEGIGNALLITTQNNATLNEADLNTTQDRSVGIIRGSSLETALNQFCLYRNLGFKKKYYKTEQDMMDSLYAGNIDFVLTTNLEAEDGMKVIAEFSAEPFYFAVSKNSTKYGSITEPLNEAMNKIFVSEPEYNQRLFNEYAVANNKKTLMFTDKENAFIKHSEPIKVAYDPNWAPLMYYNSKDDKALGAIPYLFDNISEITGLKFSFVKVNSYADALKSVSTGEADIIANFIKDYSWASQYNLRLTSPYVSVPTEIVTNEKVESDVIVMPEGYIPPNRAKQLEKTYKIEYLDTIEDCFNAVKKGKAKSIYTDSYISNYMINNKGYSGLTTAPTGDCDLQLCLGIYNGSPEELISVLDKVILRGLNSETNNFVMRATLEIEDRSLISWMYRNPSTTIVVIATIFVLILTIMYVYLRERRRSEKAMQYNLVTGIWNFSKFNVEADRVLKGSADKSKFAILHINICKFRFLNDNYGFDMGNKILKSVAEIFPEFAEPEELYASLWADHFVCLVRCDSETELSERARLLMERVNQEIYNLCEYRLTVKAGAYFITAEDIQTGKSVNNMLQYANHALATIDESYKNSMAVFNGGMKKDIETFRVINQDMINAFYDRQFIPYYQPKYNIHTKEIIGAEALVRWIHPDKGLMQPADFLPYFEKSGFIVEVDFYILEETCKNIRRWLDSNKKPIIISCNFSRLHIENHDFVKRVSDIVDRYGVPYELLELELTETIAVEEMEDITKQIRALHEAGFNVSIDDFGSGYSSLSVLQQLSVDTIKLDKTFLKNGIPTDREYKVMEAIMNLAEQLKMKVICEGVETLEQVELLKQTNCNAAQGYYFAKPMPVEELDKLLLDKE